MTSNLHHAKLKLKHCILINLHGKEQGNVFHYLQDTQTAVSRKYYNLENFTNDTYFCSTYTSFHPCMEISHNTANAMGNHYTHIITQCKTKVCVIIFESFNFVNKIMGILMPGTELS
jgi:hypothetical protein